MTGVIALPRPVTGDFGPSAAGYITLVPAIDAAVARLTSQRGAITSRFADGSGKRSALRYAPGKWSIREVLGHVCDAERIFAHRLHRIGRGNETPLRGFDENTYVTAGAFEGRPLADLIDEWFRVRNATLALVRGMPLKPRRDAVTNCGTTSGCA